MRLPCIYYGFHETSGFFGFCPGNDMSVSGFNITTSWSAFGQPDTG